MPLLTRSTLPTFPPAAAVVTMVSGKSIFRGAVTYSVCRFPCDAPIFTPFVICKYLRNTPRTSPSHQWKQQLHHVSGTATIDAPYKLALVTTRLRYVCRCLWFDAPNSALFSAKQGSRTEHHITVRHVELDGGKHVPLAAPAMVMLFGKAAFSFEQTRKPGEISQTNLREFPQDSAHYANDTSWV